ncbi:universal stress protein [uncultured Eudoraea sp.]|uniref:universal stress protein n=1 Tax=uncultured Eudoraea sp. TaxID=1035614 RepID=UPI00260E766B|nr:universal stress protein [uncultured Eudoraea sp.]
MNILLPTDFSKNSGNAISYAMELFKNEKCNFFFLHTYTPSFYRMDYMLGGPMFSAIPDSGVDISLAGLEKTLKDVKKSYKNPNHSYNIISAFNTLTDEINEVTIEKEIDMVVMGTQGATGAKEIFLGSNTVYVLRKAIAPVLVIPENYTFQKIEKILLPSDYLTNYKDNELSTAIKMVKMNKAKLIVLHVKEEYDLTASQEENKMALYRRLDGLSTTLTELKGSLMPNAILNYVQKNGIDLLMMMNRKHSFFERIFEKQNVDQIGFHIKIPFLVIRDTAKVVK